MCSEDTQMSKPPAELKSVKPRSYVCELCSRAFARSEHLKRHNLSHTKEKPFECRKCARPFSRRDLVVRHQLKVHTPGAIPIGQDDIRIPSTKTINQSSVKAGAKKSVIGSRIVRQAHLSGESDSSALATDVDTTMDTVTSTPCSDFAACLSTENLNLLVEPTSPGSQRYMGIDTGVEMDQSEVYSDETYGINKDELYFRPFSKGDSEPIQNSGAQPVTTEWDLNSFYADRNSDISTDQLMLDNVNSAWLFDFDRGEIPSLSRSGTETQCAEMPSLQLGSSSPAIISSRTSIGTAASSDNTALNLLQEQYDKLKPTFSVPVQEKSQVSESAKSENKYPAVFKILHCNETYTTLLKLRESTKSSIEMQAKEYLTGKLSLYATAGECCHSHLVSVVMNEIETDVSCYQDNDLAFLVELLSTNAIAQFTVSVSFSPGTS